MSVSTQRRHVDSLDLAGSGRTRWIALSILAHALLLYWLLNLKTQEPPVVEKSAAEQTNADSSGPHDATPEEKERQEQQAQAAAEQDKMVKASPERVQEVAQQINQIQADEVKEKVQEMLNTQQQLAEINKQKEQEFAALAQELSKDSTQKTTEALATIKQAHEDARQAEEEAVKAVNAFEQAKRDAAGATTPEDAARLQKEADSKTWPARAAQDKVKKAQAAASAAQITAAQQLGFEGAAFGDAKKLQDGANAAQQAANDRQDAASSKLRDVKKLEDSAARSQTRAEIAQHAASAAASQLESQTKALEGAMKSAESGTASAKLKARIDKMKQTLEATKRKVENTTEAAAESAETVAKARAAAASAPQEAKAAQEAAAKAQQDAGDAQSQAQAAASKAMQTTGATPSQSGTAAPANTPAPAPPATTTAAAPQSVEGKNFAELYQMAVEAEKNIAEEYKNIRAAEVAKLRQIPISEAAKSIQVAVPSRPALDPSIVSSDIKSTDALKTHNAAMEKALQQMDSMVAVSRGMASQAQSSVQKGMNVSVDGMKAEALQANKLAELATETQQGEKYADVSAVMKQIESGTGGDASATGVAVEAGSPPSGQGDATSGANTGADVAGAAATAGNNAAAGAVGANAAAAAASATTGAPGGAGAGSGGGAYAGGIAGPPPIENVKDSLPGRKVHAGGQGTGTKWMFIDTWYIIGPFPNPARRNIDTKFPPDSVIDLDAAYPGKAGKFVRWQFKQSSTVQIIPPDQEAYAIYYAYTTLWMDEARDMWIAVGSDDFSKIWINDMLVWASGMQQKPWSASEGYRKVHFKKGLNRILDRVENGQAGCRFSLMLNMNEK